MFDDRLLQLRLSKKLKQKDVADAIGVSERSYSTYENNSRDPSTDTVIKLSKFFNVSIDYLLGTSDVPTVHTSGNLNLEGLLAKIFFEISDETREEFVSLVENYIRQADITVPVATEDDKKAAKELEDKYSTKPTGDNH